MRVLVKLDFCGGTMLESIRRRLRGLKDSTSGNATILVAAGLPALLGASGLAVDSAQYYMWKRELQFAVDQAALAGAWAKTDTNSAASYSARALQEYNTNMQVAGTFDTAPTISLVNYNGGTNNAVKVASSATKSLPFTNIVIGRSITVAVEATATFGAGSGGTTTTTTIEGVTACMIALHPTANGALLIGGTASGTVSCGGATMSSDANAAIRENGNPDALFGSLAAAGGIESTLLNNIVGGNAANLRPNQSGMTNPFGSLATPLGNGIARTYSCPAVTAGTPEAITYNANQTVRTKIDYAYSKGRHSASATPITYTSGTGYLANSDNNPGITSSISRTTTAYTASGPTQAGPTTGTPVSVAGSGGNTIWRTPTTTTWTTIDPTANTVTPAVPGTDGIARPLPGTYTNIPIACETRFSPGIYVITGSIDFSNNQTITGTDVLFVMTSANNIANINSNTAITLSGITSSRLMTDYGYSSSDASKFAGMLFWDPLSDSEIKWNGNSVSILNGTMYMPNRHLWFNGTASVSGRCMMLVASRLTFTGTIDMSSFCQTSGSNVPILRETTTTTTTVGGTAATVKLVV
jgi:Flp pilus assembly protein TadG